jgi:hypothetical protein
VCQRFDGERLGKPRHAFNECVSANQQNEQQLIKGFLLADDGFAQFGANVRG